MKSIYFILTAAVLWGIGTFFSKLSVITIGPWSAAFVRSIIFLPVVTSYVFWKKEKPWTVDRRMLYPIGAGLLTGTGILLTRKALIYFEVSLVSPILRLSVLVAVVLSVLLLEEKITIRKGLGVGLALGALYLLST